MKCQTRVKLGLKDLQKTQNKDQQTIEVIYINYYNAFLFHIFNIRIILLEN